MDVALYQINILLLLLLLLSQMHRHVLNATPSSEHLQHPTTAFQCYVDAEDYNVRVMLLEVMSYTVYTLQNYYVIELLRRRNRGGGLTMDECFLFPNCCTPLLPQHFCRWSWRLNPRHNISATKDS